tara:strand:- start:4867 stop:5673 length:807 start_codon:yes stop_codon:yes gene_type:complete
LKTLRKDPNNIRLEIRQKEIEAIFKNIPGSFFKYSLELGAGDGIQSTLIAKYTTKLLSTDLNQDRLIKKSHPRIDYDICDAENLKYASDRFELIYSSNLLEHLPNPKKAILEMKRVMKDDGLMIHVIPNRFWKFLHLILFYPHKILTLIDIALFGRKNSPKAMNNNLKSNRVSSNIISRTLWPQIHGEYSGHIEEFISMGKPFWSKQFEDCDLQFIGLIKGLPAHSPYRFGLKPLRKLCEYLGLSSCNGYVITKTNYGNKYKKLFKFK